MDRPGQTRTHVIVAIESFLDPIRRPGISHNLWKGELG